MLWESKLTFPAIRYSEDQDQHYISERIHKVLQCPAPCQCAPVDRSYRDRGKMVLFGKSEEIECERSSVRGLVTVGLLQG